MEKAKKPNKVYEDLKKAILYMRVLPGTSIGENEVAAKCGVSRTPVRDAFRQLEAEGLLEVKSHVGTYVTLIDLDQIADAIFMRENLERAILKELAENPRGYRHAFRLIANLKAQKDLIDSEEMGFDFASKFMMLDNEFHRMLFELAGRESVWLYLEKGRNHYDRFRIFINQDDRTKIRRIYQQHEQLVEAIKNKDVESAWEVYNEHIYYNIQNGTSQILEHKELFKGVE